MNINKPSLVSLTAAATVASMNRGHEMAWEHPPVSATINNAECKFCGAWVQVNTSPAPNQIFIGGSSVAVNCKEQQTNE